MDLGGSTFSLVNPVSGASCFSQGKKKASSFKLLRFLVVTTHFHPAFSAAGFQATLSSANDLSSVKRHPRSSFSRVPSHRKEDAAEAVLYVTGVPPIHPITARYSPNPYEKTPSSRIVNTDQAHAIISCENRCHTTRASLSKGQESAIQDEHPVLQSALTLQKGGFLLFEKGRRSNSVLRNAGGPCTPDRLTANASPRP